MKEKKILMITGASSDVGMELIQTVHGKYECILAHYNRSNEKLLALDEEIQKKLVLLQADFSDEESIARMLEEIKARELFPDHIVHLSASKYEYEQISKISIEQWEKDMKVSVGSIIEIVKVLSVHMKKQKYGKIVFMLSSCVLNRPPKLAGRYVSTKYALLGLMKSLAEEFSDKGITVNGVSPSMMETGFLSNIPDLVIEMNAKNSPRKRNLSVEEVIPTFEFLLSEGADCITGENIAVTAGGN